MAKNYHTVLGVQPDASMGEINDAFREIARATHKDGVCVDDQRYQDATEAIRFFRSANAKTRSQDETTPTMKAASPRFGQLQYDLGDMVDEMFNSANNGSRNFYLSIPDIKLLAALLDSYKNPRDGRWNAKNEAGIVVYSYTLSKGTPSVVRSESIKGDISFHRFLLALDNLAYKIAATPDGQTTPCGREMQRINAYSLNTLIKHPGEVYKCRIETFLADVNRFGKEVEFSPANTNGIEK